MAFIKIDRELLNSYCFANANHLKIWLWLLLKANYKKSFVQLKIGVGYTTIEVDRGQLLFGRFKAEEELGIDGSMIYRTLSTFEKLEQIKIQTNNQYSLITICKYDSYQSYDKDDEQPTNNQRTTNEQQVNSRRTAGEQQVNTSKEDKEYKEVKENKEYIDKAKKSVKDNSAPPKEEFLKYCEERCAMVGYNFLEYKQNASVKYDAWLENGWKDLKGSKIDSWKGKVVSNLQYWKGAVKSNTISSDKIGFIDVETDFNYENLQK